MGGERGSKQPFRVQRKDREPYAYAGLWETGSPENSGGEERVTCTILTCDSNEIVGQVHDRMPVMLEEEDDEVWLNGGDEGALRSVLTPYPDEDLRVFPVSKKVNNPENDSPDLLDEVEI